MNIYCYLINITCRNSVIQKELWFGAYTAITFSGFIFRKFSGVKTFSSCSLSDFEIFISNMGGKCLQNKPQMQRPPASICGNRKVEGNETCDCGTEEVSLLSRKTD